MDLSKLTKEQLIYIIEQLQKAPNGKYNLQKALRLLEVYNQELKRKEAEKWSEIAKQKRHSKN